MGEYVFIIIEDIYITILVDKKFNGAKIMGRKKTSAVVVAHTNNRQ